MDGCFFFLSSRLVTKFDKNFPRFDSVLCEFKLKNSAATEAYLLLHECALNIQFYIFAAPGHSNLFAGESAMD